MGPLRESSKVRGGQAAAGTEERQGRGGWGLPAPAGMVAGGGRIPDAEVSFPEQEQKTQLEKETARSRIPRLVLRPQQKVSPASESPFSEEESREFNPPSSSGGSRRTISSNSFCSGTATGAPWLGPQPGAHGGPHRANPRGFAVTP